MGGVRLVARVFGWIGWVTLILGVLGLAAIAQQLSSAFGPRGGGLLALGTVGAGAVPLLFLVLGPFSLWALLTALCEIHAQQERANEALDDLRRSAQRTASASTPRQPAPVMGSTSAV